VEWFAAAADIHTQKCAAETLEREVAKRTAALRERSRQLAQVAAELTLAEQRERRRIAEILHDHLQQVLVGARMKIYNLTSRAGDSGKGELADLHTILTEALNTAQSITKELAPPLLPQMELPAMLQWLAREMERRHALLVEIRAEPMPDTDIPEAASVLLQTTARELFLNVVKHSGTRRAVVVCRRQADAVVLEVRDQGCGFDPTVMLSPGDVRGFGLLSIRERAELLGGRLTVDAAPGRGVQAVLTLPLARHPPARRRPGDRLGARGKARRRILEEGSSAW
jgi:signal transduction histidine kinase